MFLITDSFLENDFEEYLIDKATWAIFSGQRTNKSIQELQRRVITEWLPTSGYKYANIPDLKYI